MMFILFFLTAIANAQEISFSKALNEIVEQNVEVRVQRTKLSASESQLNAARGTFTPQLNLKFEQQNSDGTPSGGITGPGISYYTAARVFSGNATWNIFRSGSDYAGLRAAAVNRSYQTSVLDDSYLQAE